MSQQRRPLRPSRARSRRPCAWRPARAAPKCGGSSCAATRRRQAESRRPDIRIPSSRPRVPDTPKECARRSSARSPPWVFRPFCCLFLGSPCYRLSSSPSVFLPLQFYVFLKQQNPPCQRLLRVGFVSFLFRLTQLSAALLAETRTRVVQLQLRR